MLVVKLQPDILRTYAGKLRNPVSRRYLCVKNNDLLKNSEILNSTLILSAFPTTTVGFLLNQIYEF